jgi:hypothetical protein
MVDTGAFYTKVGDTVRDFFRPIAGAKWCDMLGSHNLHEWSPDGINWRIPEYFSDATGNGGSARDWPKMNVEGDEREFLSFWGNTNSLTARSGGCCSSNAHIHASTAAGSSTLDGFEHGWGQSVVIWYGSKYIRPCEVGDQVFAKVNAASDSYYPATIIGVVDQHIVLKWDDGHEEDTEQPYEHVKRFIEGNAVVQFVCTDTYSLSRPPPTVTTTTVVTTTATTSTTTAKSNGAACGCTGYISGASETDHVLCIHQSSGSNEYQQCSSYGVTSLRCAVRVFRQKVTIDDAIGSHACSLEASRHVDNGIPLGCPLLLPVHTLNYVQTLKVIKMPRIAPTIRPPLLHALSTVMDSILLPPPPPRYPTEQHADAKGISNLQARTMRSCASGPSALAGCARITMWLGNVQQKWRNVSPIRTPPLRPRLPLPR